MHLGHDEVNNSLVDRGQVKPVIVILRVREHTRGYPDLPVRSSTQGDPPTPSRNL